MTFKVSSSFIQESQDRGFLFQASHLETLDARMTEGPIVGYIGFDATAPSLHVGNLLQIMWLRLLQRTGHKPIVVMGDGTTRIGDPSGKDTQRQLLTEDAIETNIQSIQKVFSKFLTFGDGPTDAIIVRNGTWLYDLNYLDFLREYGRHFSINRMLSFDSVKLRLDREQPLSFLEFNYMVFQAYDFLELNRRFKCSLQFGGSDQWGNIINGIELIRRVDQKEAFGLTAPLITTSDGQKMGKSAQGALWLNEDMVPSFDYWQFWRNVDDADVGRFLRIYTDLPLKKIQELEALKGSDINQAKRILADEATRLCHGSEAVAHAHQAVEGLFTNSSTSFENLLQSLPHIALSTNDLEKGYSLIDALVALEFCASKGEARRLIRGLGGKVNDIPINDEDYLLSLKDLQEEPFIKITAGKKRHGLIRVS